MCVWVCSSARRGVEIKNDVCVWCRYRYLNHRIGSTDDYPYVPIASAADHQSGGESGVGMGRLGFYMRGHGYESKR